MNILRKNVVRIIMAVLLSTVTSGIHAALQSVPIYLATVTASVLNVRTGPSSKYSIAGKLSNGAAIVVTHHDGEWARFYRKGRKVYVLRSYLKKSGTNNPTGRDVNISDYSAYITATSLNVRSSPSTSSTIVGKRTKNQKVTVTHHNGAWRKILWSGRSAYVHGRYLSKRTSKPQPEPGYADVNVADYTGYVTASRLSVRNGPGTSNTIIGSKYRNQSVRVTHHSGVWRKIQWSSGRRAYVHGSYITKRKPATSCLGSITTDNLTRSAISSAKNIKNQLLVNINNPLSTGVGGLCATGLVGAGVGATVADCIATDKRGNLGVVVTFGGGLVIGAEASVTGGVMVSNASRLDDLKGWGYCVGLSGGLALGADTAGCTGLKKSANSCLYESNGILQGFVGGGLAEGVSGQVMIGHTTVGSTTWQNALRAIMKFAGTSSNVIGRFVIAIVSKIKNKVGDLGSLGKDVVKSFGNLISGFWPF